jgi:hypothetical protein
MTRWGETGPHYLPLVLLLEFFVPFFKSFGLLSIPLAGMWWRYYDEHHGRARSRNTQINPSLYYLLLYLLTPRLPFMRSMTCVKEAPDLPFWMPSLSTRVRTLTQ